MKSPRSLALLALALVLAPCGRAKLDAPRSFTPPAASPLRARVVAEPAGPYAPARSRIEDERPLPPERLADVERCAECHREVFDQWSRSAHRFSSLDNPYYAAAFFSFRRDRGAVASRWCGGCHDPALLFAGELDGAPIDRTHERARLGVGCVLCHSIERLHDRTGNANYTLASREIFVPVRTPAGGFERVDEHRAQSARPALRDASFCSTCHKVGIPEAVNEDHWLRGQNDFDPWDQSAFAGRDLERLEPDAVAPARCVDCHMPRETARLFDAAAREGTVRSHRFLGGHTALAAWNDDAQTLARQRAFLRGSVRIDLLRGAEGEANTSRLLRAEELRAGASLTVDVVLANERVGHRFPSGTADVADVWVELTLRDARGALLAHSGLEGAQGTDDEEAHRLLVRPIDERGRPALLRDPHRYRAVAFDTTVPARAARVVRYEVSVPATARGPFVLRARLLHRRLLREYERVACESAPRELGRACPTQPVTEVAVTELSATRAGDEQLPPWRRLYDHGRALAEVESEERVGTAMASLEEAARIAPERASLWVERARVLARQGRTDDALRALDEAERRAPRAPSIAFLRGQFASDVWRFAAARAPLEAAYEAAPSSLRAAELYANVLGLAGEHTRALQVVQRGLERDPERPALLQYQSLELASLGAPPAEVNLAERAWERHRPIDRASVLRGLCRRDVPGCAREALPVHTHALHTAPTPQR